jgi:hypothetical protein
LILEDDMSKNLFVISIQPDCKCRMDYFKHRNMATKIHQSKKHNKKKIKQEFKKFLKEEYGL